jgi:hypothetical protein
VKLVSLYSARVIAYTNGSSEVLSVEIVAIEGKCENLPLTL